MKILIDLQSCQSPSKNRGIGRYSLALLKTMLENSRGHDVWLLLGEHLPETVLEIRKNLHGLLPEDKIIFYPFIHYTGELDKNNQPYTRLAELMREAIIAQFNPDVVHVTSLFEGFVADEVVSIGQIEGGPKVALTVYDLIPYLNQDHFFQNEVFKTYYLKKLDSFKKADLFLAISESCQKEIIHSGLGISSEKVVEISSAANEQFCPTEKASLSSLVSFGIVRPFLLTISNVDPNKNFMTLLAAYACLDPVLRADYQLVVVIEEPAHGVIRQRMRELGLSEEEVVTLDNVSDEILLDLYRNGFLYVIPSIHEGFGLPALEAMRCGTPAIGSNTTSIPEVIGREDALFDPGSPEDMARIIENVLRDPVLYEELEHHALNHAAQFSWEKVANRVWDAIEKLVAQSSAREQVVGNQLPRLAMVAPLPPEQTGIAYYCAELLPGLSEYYDVTVVTNQSSVPPSLLKWCRIESVDRFKEHALDFDRIVYQVGNSPFHQHMPDLMKEFPGTVVLHDFYLGGMLRGMEMTGYRKNAFIFGMYASHGFTALTHINEWSKPEIENYFPANLDIIKRADGIIVHSEYARQLADSTYGEKFSADWRVVPQLRELPTRTERSKAREKLGIDENDFVVCSFGFIGPTKASLELIKAWKLSKLCRTPNAKFVFVGQNNDTHPYGKAVVDEIGDASVLITGFVSDEVYADYMACADMAVQLRTITRGETSRTVLDCLAYQLPLIILNTASFTEYPDDIMLKLPFDGAKVDVAQLAAAIDELAFDTEAREVMASKGWQYVKEKHHPAVTAKNYVEAIEHFANVPANQVHRKLLADPNVKNLLTGPYAAVFGERFNVLRTGIVQKRIFVDISAIVRNDLKTGIERVVRTVLNELIMHPPGTYRVEPVYMDQNEMGKWRFRYARNYYLRQLGVKDVEFDDAEVVPQQGDILYCLDLYWHGVVEGQKQHLFDLWKVKGAKVVFTVYDLLPIIFPQVFPPGADSGFWEWLAAAMKAADGITCISKVVTANVTFWLQENDPESLARIKIADANLNVDIESSSPTRGIPDYATDVFDKIRDRLTFLMVGTIEPRKGHLQMISAMEILWEKGYPVSLIIVGHEGWKALEPSQRRTIPEIVDRIRNHPRLNRELFWLEGISDEFLKEVYSRSNALVSASIGEGFGLPLIEAAQYGVPIIARDLPIFWEVAEGGAFYFHGETPEELAGSLEKWMELYKRDAHPKSSVIKRQSTREYVEKIGQFLVELANQ